MFLICSKGFEIDFGNMKGNYPNRKWNYFYHFQASDQKTCSIKCFSIDPRSSKSVFKTGNEIIQTGNGIISPTSKLLIKKLLFPIIKKLSEDGVNMQEGKLVRYRSFVSANKCNTDQRSFLLSRIVWGRVQMRIHRRQYPPTLHTNHNERIFNI